MGHGRLRGEPPWSHDAHLDASNSSSSTWVDRHDRRPSCSAGALAIRLAQRLPDRITALVLLDPAQGLDPSRALDVATNGMANWTTRRPEAAY